MHEGFYRAMEAIGPRSLEDLRPGTGRIALRCTLPGCTQCADFEASGAQGRFETRLSVHRTLHWDCSRPQHKHLARACGVDRIPAYVILPAKPGEIYVLEADLSA